MIARTAALAILCGVAACGTEDPAAPGVERPAFDHVFPKEIDVFGVSIRGTASTPDGKMLHAANVMAEYLDNDADGEPDNPRVIEVLRKEKATLIMTLDFSELEGLSFDDLPTDRQFQDLNASETLPDGRESGEFDATLEEVLHLITFVGFQGAYPDVFGERPGTELAKAMDVARGGQFLEIPDQYPESAWYSYDDPTCDYACMASEYIYWALTTKLGAQDFPGRLRQIEHEWRLDTAQKLAERDALISALLADPQYRLPTVLPTGNYAGGPIRFKGEDPAAALSSAISRIDVAKTRLMTTNGVEYDFRLMAQTVNGGVPLDSLSIEFADGRRVTLHRDYRRFDDGREHEGGLVTEPGFDSAIWSYINIGLPNLDAYAGNRFTLHTDINGEPTSVMVSFDSDNPTLAIPDFPVILSPEPGSTISPELVLTVEPGGFDNFVFLGLVPETEIEGVDFLEEVTTRIAAGGDQSESLALKPGRWGGDIAAGGSVSGISDGIEWSVSVSAATEIDYIVEMP